MKAPSHASSSLPAFVGPLPQESRLMNRPEKRRATSFASLLPMAEFAKRPPLSLSQPPRNRHAEQNGQDLRLAMLACQFIALFALLAILARVW
jgi:hypothetical protein